MQECPKGMNMNPIESVDVMACLLKDQESNIIAVGSRLLYVPPCIVPMVDPVGLMAHPMPICGIPFLPHGTIDIPSTTDCPSLNGCMPAAQCHGGSHINLSKV